MGLSNRKTTGKTCHAFKFEDGLCELSDGICIQSVTLTPSFTVFRDKIGKSSYFSHGPIVQRGCGHSSKAPFRFSLYEKIWKHFVWQSVPTYLTNHSKHSSRLSRWLSEEPRLQCCTFPTWGLCHQSLPNTNLRAWMEIWWNPRLYSSQLNTNINIYIFLYSSLSVRQYYFLFLM